MILCFCYDFSDCRLQSLPGKRMNYLGKFISNFRHVYNEINPATLTGAIDIVVVEQPDGTFTCSPFHVRFGKIGVLRSREKIVSKTSILIGIQIYLP